MSGVNSFKFLLTAIIVAFLLLESGNAAHLIKQWGNLIFFKSFMENDLMKLFENAFQAAEDHRARIPRNTMIILPRYQDQKIPMFGGGKK